MESLYFVAVVPPQDIRDEITEFKHYAWEHFGSRHALRSPPHVTLHMPFKWKEKRLEELRFNLDRAVMEMDRFEVILKDFDFFEPRVVFVDVLPSDELALLQKRVEKQMKLLHLFNANHKGKVFHPHVTIAFRDLRKSIFPLAKAYFQTQRYSAAFLVDHLVLLRHDGRKWDAFDHFYFS